MVKIPLPSELVKPWRRFFEKTTLHRFGRVVLRLFDQPLDEDFRSHRHTDADDGGERAQRKVLDAAGGDLYESGPAAYLAAR